VEDLHQSFLTTLNKIIEEHSEIAEEIDIAQIIADVTPDAVRLIKNTLVKSAKKMLKERRKLARGFEKRNLKRWAKKAKGVKSTVDVRAEGAGLELPYFVHDIKER
jgi:hypothetical protein